MADDALKIGNAAGNANVTDEFVYIGCQRRQDRAHINQAERIHLGCAQNGIGFGGAGEHDDIGHAFLPQTFRRIDVANVAQGETTGAQGRDLEDPVGEEQLLADDRVNALAGSQQEILGDKA